MRFYVIPTLVFALLTTDLFGPCKVVAQTVDLPSWYENSRCHAHSLVVFRSPFHGYNTPYFFKYYDYMADKGVKVSTRHIKSNANDGAVWCSEVGKIHFENGVDVRASCFCEAEKLDLPKELVTEARARGIAQILYYKHYFDKYFARNHPTWTCKAADGTPIPSHTPADPILCPNSPWREPLSIRVRELVDRGVDGIYFDWVHGAQAGCWCEYCQVKFPLWEGSGGNQLPAAYEPVMRKYYNHFLAEHFTQLMDTMHAVDPAAVAVVSSSRFASLNWDGISSELVSVVDVPKSEYTIPIRWGTAKYFFQSANEISNYDIPIPVRLGAGWATLRDVSKNRTAHVWLLADDDPDRRFGEPEFESLLGSAYSHGFVFNPAHQEADLIANDVGLYQQSYALDNKLGPDFAFKRPVKWTAILYDEAVKLKYLHDTNLSVEAQQDSLWLNYLLPFHAAYEAFKYDENFYLDVSGDTLWPGTRHPISIVTREQLLKGEMEGIYNLIVPNATEVDADLQTAINLYDSSFPDSKVLYVPENNYYHKSNTHLAHKLMIRGTRNQAFNNRRPPIYLKSKDKDTRLVSAEFYQGEPADQWDYTVAVANDFTYAIPRGIFDTHYPADFDGVEMSAPPTIVDRAMNIRMPAEDSTWNLTVIDLATDLPIVNNWYYSQVAKEYVIPLPPFDLGLYVGIAIDSSGSAAERSAPLWKIHPNPILAGDGLQISRETGTHHDEALQIRLLSTDGKVWQEASIKDAATSLPIPADLARGIYILELRKGAELVQWNMIAVQ